MVFGPPIRNFGRLALILLVFGVLFVGSVDAVACGPATEAAAVEVVAVDQTGSKQEPDNDRHGACLHGHCHHGAQQVPPLAAQVEALFVLVVHQPSGELRLASITPDSLKRPPRA